MSPSAEKTGPAAEVILARALGGGLLDKKEITALLGLSEPEETAALFQRPGR